MKIRVDLYLSCQSSDGALVIALFYIHLMNRLNSGYNYSNTVNILLSIIATVMVRLQVVIMQRLGGLCRRNSHENGRCRLEIRVHHIVQEQKTRRTHTDYDGIKAVDWRPKLAPYTSLSVLSGHSF